MNATILAHIFTTLSNLQCLSFCPSSTWNNLLSFVNSSPGINSSTLLELDVHLVCFSDCLYILDGGFSNLHTLHIDIKCIKSSDLTDRNQGTLSIPNIKCFSVYCEQITNVYHEIIVPFLRRMSNLEKLSLNLDISVRNTFIDGNDLKQNIINHLSLLKRFEFHICSNIYNSNQIHLQSKEDIQHTFRDFKDDQVISYIDHFEEREWRL
ncbi:unnamed protein product, partial [Rotaria magnacalcarata]